VGLAILVDTVGRDNIGQWMGTALSSSSIGLIISPFLGGIVYQTAGYMAVFAMAMALITIDIIMRILMIDTLSAKKYLSNEQTNILNGDASAYNTFANQTENGDPSSPGSEAELDRLLSTPQATRLPAIFTLLRSPRALAAIYGIFVNVSILATFDGILPLFLKMTFHWNSLAAGLVFLCIAVPALTGPLVGMLSDRFGPRWITVAGSAATAVPLILMRLVQGDSLEQKVLLCFLLFLCGEWSRPFFLLQI
jgi:MFS family permease